eukprot:TRINITY_DN24281_c0_g1_i1.p1 TRINITY_DN24281_c0_g1~~TRINITY_DN24281_c0_g1_i1.p1  ORF type:complete len:223 (+),score=43.09 TRINITY_DN24281_c0_g1_i1:41-709(+)
MSCSHEAKEHGHHHHAGCDHSHDDKESESVVAGEMLNRFIEIGKARGSNISEPDDLSKILTKEWENRRDVVSHIESDCDEELLIYVPFTEVVKIKSLTIVGGTPTDDSSSPAVAKLYVNRDDLDFDAAESTKPIQEIQLQKGHLGDMEYPLKVSKFSAVRDLTIVIPSNFGGETTIINSIFFRGANSKISTDRVVMTAVYETQGQLKDHKVHGLADATSQIS